MGIKLSDQIMKIMESYGGFDQKESESRWDKIWL